MSSSLNVCSEGVLLCSFTSLSLESKGDSREDYSTGCSINGRQICHIFYDCESFERCSESLVKEGSVSVFIGYLMVSVFVGYLVLCSLTWTDNIFGRGTD